MFSIEDSASELSPDFASFGWKNLPAVFITRLEDGKIKKYQYKHKTITSQHLREFIEEYFQNNPEVEPMSEEISEQDNQIIKTITTKNFKSEVIDNNETVIVLYCDNFEYQHCNSSYAIINQFSQFLQKGIEAHSLNMTESIRFGTMNVNKNEV